MLSCCKKRNFILGAAFLVGSFFIFSNVQAATIYYVSPTGSDTNPGSSSAPFKTIQRCADAASVAGDTCIVKSGTYTRASTGNTAYIAKVRYSGSATGGYITFKSENPRGAVLDGEYKGGVSGFSIYNLSYIKIEGFEIKNMAGTGAGNALAINFDASNHIVLKNNLIHDIGRRATNTPIGQECTGASAYSSYITYDSNIIYNCGRLTYYTTPQAVPGGTKTQNDATCTMAYNETVAGTTCTSTSGCNNCYNHDHGAYIAGNNYTIINNLFYGDASGWSLQIDGSDPAYPADNWDIINNTFSMVNGGRAGQVVLWGKMNNMDIQNNISVDSDYFIEPCCGATPQNDDTNVRIFNNLQYSATSLVNPAEMGSGYILSGNITSQDPKFVSFANKNFHLQSTSPAIGKGLFTGAPTYDLDGVVRGSTIDVGAYEYAAGGTPPPTDVTPPANPTGLQVQ